MNLCPVERELHPGFSVFNIHMVANSGDGEDSFGQYNKPLQNGYVVALVLNALGVEMPNIVRDPLKVPSLVSGQSKPATSGRIKTSHFEVR